MEECNACDDEDDSGIFRLADSNEEEDDKAAAAGNDSGCNSLCKKAVPTLCSLTPFPLFALTTITSIIVGSGGKPLELVDENIEEIVGVGPWILLLGLESLTNSCP